MDGKLMPSLMSGNKWVREAKRTWSEKLCFHSATIYVSGENIVEYNAMWQMYPVVVTIECI